ncbi:unnamed protein product [Linum trigynum]|uniref:Uncharacterized protein n=1 Tax=Linum trigynum TaxID=586398 RepID=A0AAV2EAF1_9ROSI
MSSSPSPPCDEAGPGRHPPAPRQAELEARAPLPEQPLRHRGRAIRRPFWGMREERTVGKPRDFNWG